VTTSARAVLSLGSNLGDREANLRSAVAAIAAMPGMVLDAASSIVETAAIKPSGVDESAPAYLNAVLGVSTTLTPFELLAAVATVETDNGRVREVRWGDRTLDIDIVTYGELRQDDRELTLPHPRAAERSFVLVPWLEIEPDAVLPGIGRVDGLPAASESVTRFPEEALS
jgi:2-amino-4-hydroxy-6-hydroxymethyldihydropteridine diphosphokinase